MSGDLAARRPWLLALPAYYLIVIALLCLAYVPRAWSSRAGTGVWSLTLVLLAAVAGIYRIISLSDYLQDRI